MAEDVQGFATLLNQILFVPRQRLEGFVTIVVPLAVITELAFRRLGRQLLEGLIAAFVALVLNVAALLGHHDLRLGGAHHRDGHPLEGRAGW